MSPLYREFARIIARIPHGRVVSYGQVARMAGRPGAARAVGWFLRGLDPGSGLPWQRVIGGDGYLRPQAGGAAGIRTQSKLLRREGVRVQKDGWLPLSRYGWDGSKRGAGAPKRSARKRAGRPRESD